MFCSYHSYQLILLSVVVLVDSSDIECFSTANTPQIRDKFSEENIVVIHEDFFHHFYCTTATNSSSYIFTLNIDDTPISILDYQDVNQSWFVVSSREDQTFHVFLKGMISRTKVCVHVLEESLNRSTVCREYQASGANDLEENATSFRADRQMESTTTLSSTAESTESTTSAGSATGTCCNMHSLNMNTKGLIRSPRHHLTPH